MIVCDVRINIVGVNRNKLPPQFADVAFEATIDGYLDHIYYLFFYLQYIIVLIEIRDIYITIQHNYIITYFIENARLDTVVTTVRAEDPEV